MTKYDVSYTKGSFMKGDIGDKESDKKENDDSLALMRGRRPASPSRTHNTAPTQ